MYKNKGCMIVLYNYYLVYVMVWDYYVMWNDVYILVNYILKEF